MMNLNSIKEVKQPRAAGELDHWRDGDAWLAGGTWLFSEPQFATDTLIDLQHLGWPALQQAPDGLEISATCTIAELCHFSAPADWTAAGMFEECSNALLASFKIWNAATVGGNICMSLPAGAMIALTVALEASYTLWPRGAPARAVAAVDFVTGDHANVLQPGELLRSIHLPATALAKRHAVRRAALTRFGRSAALIIGTRDKAARGLLLTITAATPRPVQLRFDGQPSSQELREALDERIPIDGFFGDVHGSAAYKRHLTHHFSEEIRRELDGSEVAA
ncbi:MAG: FAD binding domain-containing protein [Stellaceae bacterium]